MKKFSLFHLSSAFFAILLSVCLLSVNSQAGTRVYTQAGNSYAGSYSLGELKYLYSQIDFSGTESYSAAPSATAPYAAGKLSAGTVANTVDTINFFRLLTHLDPVTEDSSLSVYAQHAALVNCANNALSHYPDQPADMPDDIFQTGYDGAGRSNLGWGYSLQGSIRGYLDDSDNSNISRVGHRRWLLNPEMARVGLGKVGTYSALYVRDSSNTAADADFVAWPGGNTQFPSDFFNSDEAWSIHLNSDVFDAPEMSEVTVTLTRMADGKKITFGSSPTAGRFFISAETRRVEGNVTYIGNIIAGTHALIFAPDGYFGDYSGTYKVVATGLKTRSGEAARVEYTVDFGSFADTQAVPVGNTVTTEELTDARVTLSKNSFVYNGAVQKPTVTVKNAAGNALTQGEDYNVAYSAQSKTPGTYTVTVTGIGDYSGTVTKTYVIDRQALDAANMTRTPTSFYENGKQQQPTVTVKNAAGKALTEGTDYKVTYPVSIEPGSYMVRVDGINGYKGTVRKTYTIKAAEALAAANITRTPTVFYANGNQQQPTVTVKNAAGKTLKKGTDYKVTYPVSTEPGSYAVRVDGINGYKGTIRKTYTIKSVEALAAANITRTPTVFYANGKQQQPTVTVKNAAGKTLKEGTDYRVTYPVSTDPGSYAVRVDGINGYKGTIRKTYTIKSVEALSAANITRTPTSFIANGTQQQPTVTVKNAAGKVLTEGVDYRVVYPASVNPGSYMVRIDGINGYSGSIRKTYTIK